jgi:hypothetical protein
VRLEREVPADPFGDGVRGVRVGDDVEIVARAVVEEHAGGGRERRA